MFHAASFLALNAYKVGDAVPVKSGKWSVDNLYDGSPSMSIIVRRGNDIVASAQMDATAEDGVREVDLSFGESANRTRNKVVSLIREWVELNHEKVYPHALGMTPPNLKGTQT